MELSELLVLQVLALAVALALFRSFVGANGAGVGVGGHGEDDAGALFGEKKGNRNAAAAEVGFLAIEWVVQGGAKVGVDIVVIVDCKDCFIRQQLFGNCALDV